MDLEKEFSNEDVDMLIDAVDAWVDKDAAGNILIEMMEAVFVPKDAPMEMKEEIRTKREGEKLKAKSEKKLRKERAIMMKAKLLKLRDSIVASSI